MTEAAGPLRGVRVLDLTTLLPGPFCSMLLGDFGADVVKVENPREGGDRVRGNTGLDGAVDPVFAALNRNKRSIALDLKTAEGRRAFLRLADRADVVIEQFRPGVMERLGLSYEELSSRNPALVYCSITGYGQTGPYRSRPGHDLNYVGVAGILSLMEHPIPLGTQVADLGGGALMAGLGIALALYEKQLTGAGQYIDAAMLDGTVALMAVALARHSSTGSRAVPGGERLTGGLACYNVYTTADDRALAVAALEPKFWAELCRALNHAEWIPLQFGSPAEVAGVKDELTRLFQSRPLVYWSETLADLDTCVSPVLAVDEVWGDPQIRFREMVVDGPAPGGGSTPMVGVPLKLSRTPGEIRVAAPYLGQHTTEVLEQAGFDIEDIEEVVRSTGSFNR